MPSGEFGGFDLAERVPTLGLIAGAAGVLLVAAVFIRQAMRRLVAPLALGGVVAATAMYVVIGLTRADLPSDYATRSRYVYVAAFLLIPAAGDLIASLSFGRRVQRAAVGALVMLAALSLGANILDLRAGRVIYNGAATLTRAYITVMNENPGVSWPDPLMPYGLPGPERLAPLLERYGSPTEDTLVPSNVVPPGKARLERALIGLAQGSFTFTTGGPPPTGRPAIPVVLDSDGAVVTPNDGCLSVVTSGTDGRVTVSVPDGGRLIVTGLGSGTVASLGRARPPDPATARPLPPSGDDAWSIAVPNLGDDSPWRVRLDIPGPVSARLCGFAP